MRFRMNHLLWLAALQSVALAQTPMAWDDDCTNGGFDLGTLPQWSTHLISTSGQGNDFGCDPACPPPCAGCSGYGSSGSDVVATFKVPVSGLWRFSTCSTEGSLDSSLALREGGACPGVQCLEQDDASCSSCFYPRKAALSATLVAGTTYFLIVDSYSSGGLTSLQIGGPCDSSADCSDGIYCNGLESCSSGTCMSGSPCSGTTPVCDEVADVCLPCSADPAICTDNGAFCDGPGTCLPSGACAQGGDPCTALQTCNEILDVCTNFDPCLTHRNSDFSYSGTFFPQCTNQNCNTSPTGDYSYADDIELEKHSSRLVTSYQFYGQWSSAFAMQGCNNNGAGPINPGNLGDPIIINTALFTVEPGTCFPDRPIPGTLCSVLASTTGPDSYYFAVNCELPTPVLVPDGTDAEECAGGAQNGLPCTTDADCPEGTCEESPTSQCGIDFFIAMNSNIDSAGATIGCDTLIGGPGIADELGGDAMIFATCTAEGVWNGWRWLHAAPFGACAVNRGNFRGEYVCTVPTGACCSVSAGTCNVVTQEECDLAAGVYLGDIQVDGSGSCDDGIDSDQDGTRDECDLCDNDPMKTSPGQCGCAIADTDADDDGTADCIDGCPLDHGKIAPGICGCGTPDTDSDGDETPDCSDSCPQDPEKLQPGICGYGVAETGDTDGDDVSDCVDQCPGADDGVFAPLCAEAIPAASHWTMICLTLTLLILAKLRFGVEPCGV